jgi:hypothetical protein
MKSSTHLITLCLACLLILLTACSTPSDEVYLQKAEKISNQLLDAMANQRYDEAVSLYGERFFERITPEAWKIDLKKLSDKIGQYKSKKITASNVTHGFSTISAVTTVLVYRVNYQKSYTVQKFTFMSNEQADNMTLVGHYIDFPEQK